MTISKMDFFENTHFDFCLTVQRCDNRTVKFGRKWSSYCRPVTSVKKVQSYLYDSSNKS